MMEVIGDYEYSKKDLIGHGAFAVVFKGKSRKTFQTVAIKCITKKNLAKSQNLLSKEIKILKELSDLHHENVVALLDCKETTNHVYLVMEYCNGGDLADYLQVKGTLSEVTISAFLRQIAAAMKALHGKGIVHRDLKPQNILLTNPQGKSINQQPTSEICLKIADFGFARFLSDGVMAATLCGSPMYMAPEVIMSMQYDAKADLWSIGTIVFQCLTGKAPFQAQTPQQLKHFYEKHADLKPNVPKDTSPELRDLLLQMLKRNAKDRIEFVDFFVHPFLKPPSPIKTTSSPVPVPRRSSNSRGYAASSHSPTPPRCISASPLSGKVEYSPPPPPPSPRHAQRVTEAVRNQDKMAAQASDSETDDFLKVEKVGKAPGRQSPTEDFVMVPTGIPCDSPKHQEKTGKAPLAQAEDDFGSRMDTPPKSLNTVRVSPTQEAVSFAKAPPPMASPGQTSPSRPSTLPMAVDGAKPSPSSKCSQPIPVPGQVQAYKKMQQASPSSPKKAMDVSPVSVSKPVGEKRERKLSSHVIESKLSGPDVGSMSPPPVKFCIGTPPGSNGQWRRPSAGGATPQRSSNPASGSSPLRRSVNSSPVLPVVTNTAAFPAILGSPPKFPQIRDEGRLSPDSLASEPVLAPFGCSRPNTMPENMAAVPYKSPFCSGNNPAKRNLMEQGLNQCPTEPTFSNRAGGSLLSEQLVKLAFGTNQPAGTMVPYSSGWKGSKEIVSSPVGDKPGSFDNERSPNSLRRGSASPPSTMVFATSPPNMEGPVTFVAPELAEETLMDEKHNETMAKLSFVLDLVDCIVELANSRGTMFTNFSDSMMARQGENALADNTPKVHEPSRRIEQLVLFIRCLHLLSSSLQLARTEIKEERLFISNSLKSVLKQMKESYHHCVTVSKQIQNRLGPAIQQSLTPQLAVATADKLIYNYAIEICQSTALDEMFSNPNECFKRYQTAQILLHSLSQQARNERDKQFLNKYKEAVERRLAHIHKQVSNQAYLQPVDMTS